MTFIYLIFSEFKFSFVSLHTHFVGDVFGTMAAQWTTCTERVWKTLDWETETLGVRVVEPHITEEHRLIYAVFSTHWVKFGVKTCVLLY